LISLYSLLKKLRFNRTSCQHTVRGACTTIKLSQDVRLHSTWYVVSCLLIMQNMIVKEPCNVFLLHSMSISFHTFDDIARRIVSLNSALLLCLAS